MDAITIKHIPALDGLRGFAILAIAFSHFLIAPNWKGEPAFTLLSGGWIFVDCFFTLSGFLITSILLDTRLNADYFKKFYYRRLLRIMPLYFFAIITVFFVSVFIEGRSVNLTTYDSLLWYILYLPNIALALKTTWLDHSSLLEINHLWAIGVEEQFYLIWPMIVYLLPLRMLLLFSAAILIFGSGIRQITGNFFGDIWGLAPYVLTWCRMDSIAAGTTIAILMRLDLEKIYIRWNRKSYLIFFGIITAIISSYILWLISKPFNQYPDIYSKINFWSYIMYIAGILFMAFRIYHRRYEKEMIRILLRTFFKTFFIIMLTRLILDLIYGGGLEKFTHAALCFSSLIYILATSEKQSFIKNFFESRLLMHIGFFSYGIYLFHQMLRPVWRNTFERWFFMDAALNPFLAQFLYIYAVSLCSYLLARLSWIIIEQPFMKLKK